MKIHRFLFLAAAAAMVFAASGAERADPWMAQSNGLWSAVLDARVKPGTELWRAQMFEQKLYVRGPSNTTPRLLLTETSSHFVKFWLGPNGILAAQPTGKAPCVFFTGREEPVIVQMPQPATTNRYGPRHSLLPFDRCWFSGDALLFESHIWGGPDYLLGLFLLDAKKKTVSTGRICLELNEADYFLAESARVYGDKMLFAGTHVFWENAGWRWGDSRFGKPVPGIWRTRQIRAFDLDRKEILSGNEIPRALIAEHKEALEKVFGHALD